MYGGGDTGDEMWDLRASEEGNLMFELYDKEGKIVETIMLENLEPEEELFVEMFEGEIRGVK